MRKTVVPLLKNSLFALFLLLVSPLFFSSVATAQVACNCNDVFDQHSGPFILNRTGQPCCFQISFDRITNPCNSNITNVEYNLEGAPPCLDQTYKVFNNRAPFEQIGAFNPFTDPFPISGLPISPGTTMIPSSYKICPEIIPGDEDYPLCPCAITNFKVNIKITFADGTTCERKKDVVMWNGGFPSGCCYDVIGVSEVNQMAPEIELKPNPTQNVITAIYSQELDINSKYTIDIVDVKGIVVKSNFLTVGANNTFSVEVEDLPVGTYLYTLRNEKDILFGAKQFTINR